MSTLTNLENNTMNIHQRRRLARAEALAAEQAKESAPIILETMGGGITQEVTEGLDKATLNNMTKSELEELGRAQFDIELDRRKTKATLVKEILKAQN